MWHVAEVEKFGLIKSKIDFISKFWKEFDLQQLSITYKI
jgi:hypothetical protein